MYNIYLISINNTVSDGVTSAKVLNIEKVLHDLLS